MAWTFVELVSVKQNELSLRWYAKAIFTDGNEVRSVETKFPENPTNQQLIAARNALLLEMNAEDDMRRNPPNLADNLTNPQKVTLRDSVTILEGTRQFVPVRLQAEFDSWFNSYKAGLTRLFR